MRKIVNVRYKKPIRMGRSVTFSNGGTFDPKTNLLPREVFPRWKKRCKIDSGKLANGDTKFLITVPIDGAATPITRIIRAGKEIPSREELIEQALIQVCQADGTTVNVYEEDPPPKTEKPSSSPESETVEE